MATVIIDGTRYATHVVILNGLFGKHYRAYQGAECKLGNGYSVWFPVVTRTVNKAQATPASNGWKNLLVNGDMEICQYWPDSSKAPLQKAAKEKRIAFAKFSPHGKYTFIGVFEHVASKQDHTVYKRIAVQYPIHDS